MLIDAGLMLAGGLFVSVGAALASNWRQFAGRMANWANQLDPDRWYFLPGKAVTVWRARFYGCVMVCVGAIWIVGGVGRLWL